MMISEHQVLHEGYLEKLSQSKRWQKRYFEIAGHYLRYYSDDKSKGAGDLRGGVDLKTLVECEITPTDSKGRCEIAMQFMESNYHLRAANKVIGDGWLSKLMACRLEEEGRAAAARLQHEATARQEAEDIAKVVQIPHMPLAIVLLIPPPCRSRTCPSLSFYSYHPPADPAHAPLPSLLSWLLLSHLFSDHSLLLACCKAELAEAAAAEKRRKEEARKREERQEANARASREAEQARQQQEAAEKQRTDAQEMKPARVEAAHQAAALKRRIEEQVPKWF
jgi:hypothetical protein